MAGIWLAETLANRAIQPPEWLTVLIWGLPVVAASALLFGLRRHGPSAVVTGLLTITALSIGYLRHQAASAIPANHICHALNNEPVLTRLSGQVVSAPVTHPGEKHNPFIPFDPPARTRFVLAAQALCAVEPPTAVTGHVQVTVEGEPPALQLGDQVTLIGHLYRPRGPRNPGETDWAEVLRLQNIRAGLSVEGPQYVTVSAPAGGPYARFVTWLRGRATGLLFEPHATAADDDARDLLAAMVLGQRSAVNRQVNEAFLRTGTIHFLSVSGAHIALLAGAAWWTVRVILRRGTRAAAGTTLILIVLYTLLAEPNAPIRRAAVMGILVCLAALSNRPFSALNWLALSVLIILAGDPLELFRPSFQLSFTQFLALAIIVQPIYRLFFPGRGTAENPPDTDTYRGLLRLRLFHLVTRGLAGVAITSVIAWLIALPLTLYHFGYWTPFGAVQSVLLAAPITLTILLAFVTLLCKATLAGLGTGLAELLTWATNGLLALVERLSHLPGALVKARPPPAWLVFATYGLVLATVAWLRQAGRHQAQREELINSAEEAKQHPANWRKWLMPATAAVSVLFLWLTWIWKPASEKTNLGNQRNVYTLWAFAVGNGSATLLITPAGEAALFDLGTTANGDTGEMAAEACRALGVRKLVWAAVSHSDFDHFSGLGRLLEEIPAEQILVNPYFLDNGQHGVREFLRRLPPHAARPEAAGAGRRFGLESARAEVIWPPSGSDGGTEENRRYKDNDQSLVFRVVIGTRGENAPDEKSDAGKIGGAASAETGVPPENPSLRILIPGDIERAAMEGLLEREKTGRISLKADVLVAPHHGSIGGSPAAKRTTAAFYRAVAPKYVVVSTARDCGKLRELLRETLGEACQAISTREAGAICVRRGANGELRVETPYAEH